MRKTGIVLGALLLFLLFVPLSQAGVNETEPNDTLNQATTFRIGDSAAGTLLRPPSDSRDYWRFSLDRDAKVSLDVTPSEGLLMSSVYIYNENKSSYATFAAPGEKRTFTGYLKGGKTYYLELNGRGAAGAYTITSHVEYPAYEGEREPNDTLDAPVPHTVNSTSTGHLLYTDIATTDNKDTWRFTLERDAKVSLEFSPFEELALGSAYIYNENKSSYATFGTSVRKKTFTAHLKGGKTYYLELNGTGGKGGSYALVSQAEYPARDAEKEPNDTFDAATVHNPNTTAYGHLLYTDIAATDTKDMWRFSLDRDARIVMDITPADGLTIGSAYIYNENRSSYATLGAKGNGKSATTYLQGGKTYYVEVNGTGSGGYYSFTTAVQYPTYGTELKGADTANDAMANATEITAGTVYGHLGYTDIRSTDTVDYWRFSLREERCIDFKAEPVEGELSFTSAYLYLGNKSTYNSFTADGRGFAFKKCLKPDNYYIELSGRNSGSYRLVTSGAGLPEGGTGRPGETEPPIQIRPPEPGRPETADINLSGNWLLVRTSTNTVTKLTLVQSGSTVTGIEYWEQGAVPVTGDIANGTLTLKFTYTDPQVLKRWAEEEIARQIVGISSTAVFPLQAVDSGYRGSMYPWHAWWDGSRKVSNRAEGGSQEARAATTSLPLMLIRGDGMAKPAEDNLQNVKGKELISNSVLKTALCGWDVVEWHKPADGKGEVTYEADGVRFKSLSGNTRIGIRQDREADVSKCRRLVLGATVKVERQTLTGTGWNGREAPVGIFVSYTDADGGFHNLLSENPSDPKRMFWQGFYSLDPVSPSLSTHGTKVQQGTWYTYRVNLSTLKPATVHYIGAEGAGWSPREAVIKDINLICEE